MQLPKGRLYRCALSEASLIREQQKKGPVMPRHPYPPGGDKPFPRSIAWNGEPWAQIIDHHIGAHAAGPADTLIGFDDDDRLCVVQRGNRGYATRIPASLVAWTQTEMDAEAITALPAHPGQLRFARGPGGSLLRDGADLSREQIITELMAFTGLCEAAFSTFCLGDVQNMNFGNDLPVKVGEFANGDFPFAYIQKSDARWDVYHGTIEPTGLGDANIIMKVSSQETRVLRGGTVHRWASANVDDRLEVDRDLVARAAQRAADLERDQDPSP